ncbi:hypothetical protein M885DRAFT_505202 [Pelagophyceae sp. CCMP2097]|nr:hypothetical protein M885DRAFT_505202 [Pelagophyceae sp. CCMP2097]
MADYASVKRAAFKGKGGLFKKPKREKRAKKAPQAEAANDDEEDEEAEDFKVCVGAGRISTSGTAVMGYDGSKFMSELHVGDAVIISHPNTLIDETRIVKMVLSDISISISSPFSTDLISTTAFRFISAPRIIETAAMKDKKMREAYVSREDTAVGDYAGGGGTQLVYRQKKGGMVGGSNAYHIVKVDLGHEVSRTEMMNMRSKYKSDRHCA